MELMKQTYYENYGQFKQELDTEMHRTAEQFVKLGFLLNIAASTDILLESGYSNVNEFAKAEYKLEESQVSRFINIYKRFGVEGEPRLQAKYADHGVAKLAVMLTLPDFIVEEIPSSFSKTEINVIKKEVEAEQKITDIEVMLEEKDPVQQSLPEGWSRLVYQLVRSHPQEYAGAYEAKTLEGLKKAYAPADERMYTFRIPGTGKVLMLMKVNEDITVTYVRSGEKEAHTWEELFDTLRQEYVSTVYTVADSWRYMFHEPFPLESQARMQEEAGNASKPVPELAKRKESRVKTPELTKPDSESVKETGEMPEKNREEQLPGQDSIMNHPEYLPDNMQEEKEVLTGEVVEAEILDDADVQQSLKEESQQEEPQAEETTEYNGDISKIAPVQPDISSKELKQSIREEIVTMMDLYENSDWNMLISRATAVIWKAKKMKELEAK